MQWKFVGMDFLKVSGPCLFIGKRKSGQLTIGFADKYHIRDFKYVYLDMIFPQYEDLDCILYTYSLYEPFIKAEEIIEHEKLKEEMQDPEYLKLKTKELATDLALFLKKHKIVLSELK